MSRHAVDDFLIVVVVLLVALGGMASMVLFSPRPAQVAEAPPPHVAASAASK